jgi:hypothetical protein
MKRARATPVLTVLDPTRPRVLSIAYCCCSSWLDALKSDRASQKPLLNMVWFCHALSRHQRVYGGKASLDVHQRPFLQQSGAITGDNTALRPARPCASRRCDSVSTGYQLDPRGD